jgi:hypothetical protein
LSCPTINIYDFSMTINLDELEQWIGREEALADWATPTPLQALAAALDREDPAPEPGDASCTVGAAATGGAPSPGFGHVAIDNVLFLDEAPDPLRPSLCH